jgi:predicted  nucleic acid-binding Zn-ribbon protein
MKIENQQKEDERWEKLADQLQDQVEKLQTQIESLNQRLEAKDARIIELEDRGASLQQKLDTARTQCSIATMLRCNKISCTDRVPPISEAFTGDISKQLTDYIEKM